MIYDNNTNLLIHLSSKQPEQGSDEWKKKREYQITGSISKKVEKYKNNRNLKINWNSCKFTGNKYTEHGHKYEPYALDLISEKLNDKILKINYIEHKYDKRFACSPDGWCLNNNCLIEIKCPYTEKRVNQLIKKIDQSHYFQIQHSLFVLNSINIDTFCLYCVYDCFNHKVNIERIDYDENYWPTRNQDTEIYLADKKIRNEKLKNLLNF